MITNKMISIVIEEMTRAEIKLDASIAEPISAALQRIAKENDARVTELIRHNNELLERARKAEHLVDSLKVSLKGCATVVGMFAQMEEVK